VIQNWEAIKAQERQENGESSKKGLLDGVPSALPALAQAQEIVERVGRVKEHQLAEMGQQTFIIHLIEEITDADEAKVSEIFGQILLGVASWAHQKDVDAESALREALSRFRAHFRKGEANFAKPGSSDGYVNNDEKGREE
jgi:uncharacterized protein YabN with tetrapyrrole methylase and pyrophosphatase domain